MSEFLQLIATGFALLPPYLIVITIALVILPTIVVVFLRYSLYSHLRFLRIKVRKLLAGVRQGKQPRIIENLEKRFQEINSNLEQVNTLSIIEGLYDREYFRFLGLPLRCEPLDYFTRVLPNLLLSFGLLGTFLGITINLANISQTISQVEITDIRSLVEELNQPLQGMGIAFISSLVAVACSAFLIVVNLSWNTSIAKVAVINSLEDYIDNIYLPDLPRSTRTEKAVDRLINEFGSFLEQFGNTFEQSIGQSIAEPVKQLVEESSKITELAQEAYNGILDSSTSIENSAYSFEQAANTIEKSRFAEKLSSATTDLSIAQNQFSQSSLVLKKSTQSMEDSLETLQKSSINILNLSQEITNLNQQYAEMVNLHRERSEIERAGLEEIKTELADLLQRLTKS